MNGSTAIMSLLKWLLKDAYSALQNHINVTAVMLEARSAH